MGGALQGWEEAVIEFPPTYKYIPCTDKYVGDSPARPPLERENVEIPDQGLKGDEGEQTDDSSKRRTPAWCVLGFFSFFWYR